MRALPVGVPKLHHLLGRVGRRRPLCRPGRYHHDVFGHRRAGPQLDLARGARQRRQADGRHGEGAPGQSGQAPSADAPADLPSVGITMFGVTTPCRAEDRGRRCAADFECLVFHATGVGGRSMEKLVDSGMLAARHRPHDDRSLRSPDGRRVSGRPTTALALSSAPACPSSARSARSTWSISARPTPSPSAIASANSTFTIRR